MNTHDHDHDTPKSTEQLPDRDRRPARGRRSEVVDLADGDTFELRIAPVAKRLGDGRPCACSPTTARSPARRCGCRRARRSSSTSPTRATSRRPCTGTACASRTATTARTRRRRRSRSARASPTGVQFPDPGVYWYHPHIREDYGQELGLYGNILVVPADPDYWPPVNRELLLTLDDVLIEDGKIAPFSRTETTYVAMGRFGNILLIGGEPDLKLTAQLGEVVRFYLTNTANTRVFNVGLPGARMKLVGGDSGRCEHEEFVEEVLLAPSERVVVDVLFDRPGRLTLEHRHARAYATRSPRSPSARTGRSRRSPSSSRSLRRNADMVAERERVAPYLSRRARQDARVRRRDGHGRPRGRGRLHLPDAPRGRQRRRGKLPGVRDEAPGDRGSGDATPARCTPRS